MSGRVDVALVENLLLVSDGFRKKYSGQIDVKEMDVSVHDLVVFQIRHKQASYGIVITHLWPLALPRRAHLRNDYDDIRGAIETAIKRKPITERSEAMTADVWKRAMRFNRDKLR